MQAIATNICKMEIKVYVLIENNDVKCYHNLKSLCDDNPHLPYHTIRRRLLKPKYTLYNSSSIYISTINYNTKRRIPPKYKE